MPLSFIIFRRLAVLLTVLLLPQLAAAQFEAPQNFTPRPADCLTQGRAGQRQTTTVAPNTAFSTPSSTSCDSTQTTYVAVHVHFIQNPQGGENFQPVDDTTTLDRDENGYRWATKLIWNMNWPGSWFVNPQMKLPVGNTTRNPPKNVQFVLRGVWFDRVPAAADDTLRRYFYSYAYWPGGGGHPADTVVMTPPSFANYYDDWQYKTFGKDKRCCHQHLRDE